MQALIKFTAKKYEEDQSCLNDFPSKFWKVNLKVSMHRAKADIRVPGKSIRIFWLRCEYVKMSDAGNLKINSLRNKIRVRFPPHNC